MCVHYYFYYIYVSKFLVFKCRLRIKKCKIDLRIGWFIVVIFSRMRCFLILCVLMFVSCNSGEKKDKDSGYANDNAIDDDEVNTGR
jgi:hypothetical protein